MLAARCSSRVYCPQPCRGSVPSGKASTPQRQHHNINLHGNLRFNLPPQTNTKRHDLPNNIRDLSELRITPIINVSTASRRAFSSKNDQHEENHYTVTKKHLKAGAKVTFKDIDVALKMKDSYKYLELFLQNGGIVDSTHIDIVLLKSQSAQTPAEKNEAYKILKLFLTNSGKVQTHHIDFAKRIQDEALTDLLYGYAPLEIQDCYFYLNGRLHTKSNRMAS